MPRAIWTGSVSFGLVSVPVRLYSAIDEHDLELHLVHEADGSRIGYRKICKAEDAPVPDDEVAKAYEVDGKLVLLDDDDFAAARGERTKVVEIVDFVPYEGIDPIYFERTYYLGPEPGSEKVYAVLVAAMERAGLAAVVRFFFRDREQLACLRTRDGILLLEKMYYGDEIRPAEELGPDGRTKVDARELELALTLIEAYTGSFEPSRYEDTYQERLRAVVGRKRRGEAIEAPAVEEAPVPTDLLAVLRASVEQATRDRRGRAPARNGSSGNGSSRDGSRLEDLTVEELARKAKRLRIEGRSKMTKRELVGAIREAES